MSTHYDQIAGQSVQCLASLSDGVFAVAVTLLVLGLRVPIAEDVHSDRDLWCALVVLAPRFIMYLMSFLTLGIFWVGQQTQLNHLARSDRHLTWIHLAFLFAVCITPFSTTLLAEYPRYRIALLGYWGNILLMGAVLYGSWGYATRRGLLKDDTSAEVPAAICRRIVIAQSFYVFGALLCIFDTYWSIAFIVLVQLNYAIAPRFRRRAWLPSPLERAEDCGPWREPWEVPHLQEAGIENTQSVFRGSPGCGGNVRCRSRVIIRSLRWAGFEGGEWRERGAQRFFRHPTHRRAHSHLQRRSGAQHPDRAPEPARAQHLRD